MEFVSLGKFTRYYYHRIISPSNKVEFDALRKLYQYLVLQTLLAGWGSGGSVYTPELAKGSHSFFIYLCIGHVFKRHVDYSL